MVPFAIGQPRRRRPPRDEAKPTAARLRPPRKARIETRWNTIARSTPERDFLLQELIGLLREAHESRVFRSGLNAPGRDVDDAAKHDRFPIDGVLHGHRAVAVLELA